MSAFWPFNDHGVHLTWVLWSVVYHNIPETYCEVIKVINPNSGHNPCLKSSFFYDCDENENIKWLEIFDIMNNTKFPIKALEILEKNWQRL